jgi:hypothetical protein
MLGNKIDFEIALQCLRPQCSQIINEKPKKGEEELDENGEFVEVDTRTGFYPDDIANTFGVPMAQYKKEMEITDMDGYVEIAGLTGVRKG